MNHTVVSIRTGYRLQVTVSNLKNMVGRKGLQAAGFHYFKSTGISHIILIYNITKLFGALKSPGISWDGATH